MINLCIDLQKERLRKEGDKMNTEVNFETEKDYQKSSKYINDYFIGIDGKSARFTDTRDHYENGDKTVRVNCWHEPKKITIRGEDKTELSFLEKEVKKFKN